MQVAELIQWTSSKVYSGPVRQLGKCLGIDNYLQRKYNWLQSFNTPDRHEISIAGARATFDTSSIEEYRRATTFVERDALSDFIENLRSDDVFWDVGANTGIYTCLAADVTTGGKIHAFEPHPANVDSLTSNVEINDLNNVDIRQCALSDSSGTMGLQVTTDKPGIGLHSLGTESDVNTIDIETVTGDELIAKGDAIPTVVKIDVEGAEGTVLDGMVKTLARPKCRLVYCEIHASKSLPNSVYDFGDTPEEIEEQLREAGFTLETVDEGNAYMVRGFKDDE